MTTLHGAKHHHSADGAQGRCMMQDMMGPMTWGMGLVWLLVLIVLLLAIAALVKYVFFK